MFAQWVSEPKMRHLHTRNLFCRGGIFYLSISIRAWIRYLILTPCLSNLLTEKNFPQVPYMGEVMCTQQTWVKARFPLSLLHCHYIQFILICILSIFHFSPLWADSQAPSCFLILGIFSRQNLPGSMTSKAISGVCKNLKPLEEDVSGVLEEKG